MQVVTADQMKKLDAATINETGIPGIVLMENAGRGTFQEIKRSFPDWHTQRIIVLCGRGNNGGDGFVIARYFFNAGADVTAFLCAPRDKVAGDARINLEAFLAMGGRVRDISDEQHWADARSGMLHAGIVVDALLGTGLVTEVRGLYRSIIEDVNEHMRRPVVSVDVPSGVDATSGQIRGVAVKAQLTCTFGLPKRGLLLFPGAAHAGRLEVIDIGIPEQLVAREALQEHLLEDVMLRGTLSPRAPQSHKGTYGHVCVIAGSAGKTGAAAMAARAAMRTGAGLVTLAIPESLNPILEAKLTEEMTEPIPDHGRGFLEADAWPRISAVLEGKTVAAVGPGLAQHRETAQIVCRIVESAQVPLVIDADGLNVLAEKPALLKQARAPVVITPHPGEMARLMGTAPADIQSDRVAHARNFSMEYGTVVVLKGARTIIAEPRGHVYINPTGNPGMASGGMGDVLTGMIAGLMAQGISALESSKLAVFVHGCIGDQLAREKAPCGILASDVIAMIPGALVRYAG